MHVGTWQRQLNIRQSGHKSSHHFHQWIQAKLSARPSWCSICIRSVSGLGKQFESIVFTEEDAVGLQHLAIAHIRKTGQQSRERKTHRICDIERVANEHAAFVQRYDG